MRDILGHHNTTTATSNEIKSDFNEWAAEKQLVNVEEILALGRREIMNSLKPLITEPTLVVNVKHLRRYEIENTANFLFLTNHEDALRLEKGDRRYFLIASDKGPKDAAYYRRLFTWCSENPGVIPHWLLQRDISNFNPQERPPMTPRKVKMTELSRDPREVTIAELIAEREPPFHFDLFAVTNALSSLRTSGNLGGLGLTRPDFQRLLHQVGAVNLGQKKIRQDGVMIAKSLWACRDVERYQLMTSAELIAAYDRQEIEF